MSAVTTIRRSYLRMNEHNQFRLAGLCSDNTPLPVMICLLGNFRLLVAGEPISSGTSGKREMFLSLLALRSGRRVSREQLVQVLWPASEPTLARNSLHNLIYHLHKLLSSALGGAAPVLHEDGDYWLNTEAGVGVDVACFDYLVEEGDRQIQVGDPMVAIRCYDQAVKLYRDDLQFTPDVQTVMQRERLRGRYVTLLIQIAEYYYRQGAYNTALRYLWQMLMRDPSREDAHRLLMRCYVRRGERAEALRHYRVCVEAVRTEFDAPPEPATVALFDQIRFTPDQI